MLRRSVQFAIGIFLYGFAIGMMLQAAIGVSPWDVLGQGLAIQTGLPFGVVTNIIGALVLLLWIPIRQRPGWGTVLNVLFVGYSAQVGLAVIPAVDSLWIRVPSSPPAWCSWASRRASTSARTSARARATAS